MKRLLDRFVSSPPATRADEAADADDEGFFSTQFMERPEQGRASSAWTARALAVGAQPLDAEPGLALLLQTWGQDAFMASLVQDERGDYALIVLEGLVAVDRVQPTGARARLAEAREGDVLGEMSLLDAGARFASCLTLSRTALAVLTSEALDELAIEEPRLALALMTSVARRLSLRMRQLSARLGALLTAG